MQRDFVKCCKSYDDQRELLLLCTQIDATYSWKWVSEIGALGTFVQSSDSVAKKVGVQISNCSPSMRKRGDIYTDAGEAIQIPNYHSLPLSIPKCLLFTGPGLRYNELAHCYWL